MTLEAIVFQQNQISYGSKDHFHNFGIEGENWSYGYGFEESKAYSDETHNNYMVGQREQGGLKKWESSPSSLMVQDGKEYDTNSSSPEACNRHDDGFFPEGFPLEVEAPPGTVMPSRPKRRRTRSFKNKDEVENQRMTHITVERNRRKQMNDYLSVLRSLMPPSYVQRGDQASIVGGAINFVKELEQLLQSLESNKQMKQQPNNTNTNTTSMFSDFFTFPQYSTCSATQYNNTLSATATEEKRSAVADVEVTMVDSHANVKILTKKRSKQLLKMVMRLQSLNLTILHLNITTTVDELVLYSISVKVEEGCQLTSVNDIATAVYEMVGLIQEESNFGWKP